MEIEAGGKWITDAIANTGAAGLRRVVRITLPPGTRRALLRFAGPGPLALAANTTEKEAIFTDEYIAAPGSTMLAAPGDEASAALESVDIAVLGPCWLLGVEAWQDDTLQQQSSDAKAKNASAITRLASQASGALLWPHRAFRLHVQTTLDAHSRPGKPLAAALEPGQVARDLHDYAYFATSGPPGLASLSSPAPSGGAAPPTAPVDAAVERLATLLPYVRATLPPAEADPAPGAAADGVDAPSFALLPVAIDFESADIALLYRLARSDLALVLLGPAGEVLAPDAAALAPRASTFVPSPLGATKQSAGALWLEQLSKVVKPLPPATSAAWLGRERLWLEGVRRPLGALCHAEARPLLLCERFEPPLDGSAPTLGWPVPGWQALTSALVDNVGATSEKAQPWKRVTTTEPSQGAAAPLAGQPHAIEQTLDAGQAASAGLRREGPLLVYRGEPDWRGMIPANPDAWTSYSVSAWLRPVDNQGIGLLARYQDATPAGTRYYRLELDAKGCTARLTRRIGEAISLLCERPFRYDPGRDMLLELRVEEVGDKSPSTTLHATIDGIPLLGAVDATPGRPHAGTVALYCWWQQGPLFGDVRVFALDPAAPAAGPGEANPAPGRAVLRWPVPTSPYLDFGHQLQSGDGVLLHGKWKPNGTALQSLLGWIGAAAPWTPDPSPPTEAESRAAGAILAALRCANPVLATPAQGLRVASCEVTGAGSALLLESPTPWDWRRTALLAVTARGASGPLAPRVWLRPRTAAIVAVRAHAAEAPVDDAVELRLLEAPPGPTTLEQLALGDPLAMLDAPTPLAPLQGTSDAGLLFRAAMGSGVLAQFAPLRPPPPAPDPFAAALTPTTAGPWSAKAASLDFKGLSFGSVLQVGVANRMAPRRDLRIVARIELAPETSVGWELRRRAFDDRMRVTLARPATLGPNGPVTCTVTALRPGQLWTDVPSTWTPSCKVSAADPAVTGAFDVEVLCHGSTLVVFAAGRLAFVSTALTHLEPGIVALAGDGASARIFALEVVSLDAPVLALGPAPASDLGLALGPTSSADPSAALAQTTTVSLVSGSWVDVDVSCDLRWQEPKPGAASPGAMAGVVARWQGDGEGIAALVRPLGDGKAEVRVEVRHAGATTTLAIATLAFDAKLDHRVRLQVCGPRVRTFIDATLCCDVEPKDPVPTQGSVGVISSASAEVGLGVFCVIALGERLGPFVIRRLGQGGGLGWQVAAERLMATDAAAATAAPTGSLATGHVVTLADRSAADARISAKVWLPATGTADLLLRLDDAGRWVAVQVARHGYGSATLYLIRHDGKGAQILTTINFPTYAALTDAAGELRLTFEACGRRLRAWVGEQLVAVAQVSDVGYGAAGCRTSLPGASFGELEVGAPWPQARSLGFVPADATMDLRWSVAGDAGAPMTKVDGDPATGLWSAYLGWWSPAKASAGVLPVLSPPLGAADVLVATRVRIASGRFFSLLLADAGGSGSIELRSDWELSPQGAGVRRWRLLWEAPGAPQGQPPQMLWNGAIAPSGLVAHEAWVLERRGDRLRAWVNGLPLFDRAHTWKAEQLRCGIMASEGCACTDLQAHSAGLGGSAVGLVDDLTNENNWTLAKSAGSTAAASGWAFTATGATPPHQGDGPWRWRLGPSGLPRRVVWQVEYGANAGMLAFGLGKTADGGPSVEVRHEPTVGEWRLRIRSAGDPWVQVAALPVAPPAAAGASAHACVVLEIHEDGCRAFVNARALGATDTLPATAHLGLYGAGAALTVRSLRVEIGRWVALMPLRWAPSAAARRPRAGDVLQVALGAGPVWPSSQAAAPPAGQPAWPRLGAAPRLRLRPAGGEALHEVRLLTTEAGFAVTAPAPGTKQWRTADGRALLLWRDSQAGTSAPWTDAGPLQLGLRARWLLRPTTAPDAAASPSEAAIADLGSPSAPGHDDATVQVVG